MECEDIPKINEDILPDSIIHEHVYDKPKPTPKITSSYPNITRT